MIQVDIRQWPSYPEYHTVFVSSRPIPIGCITLSAKLATVFHSYSIYDDLDAESKAIVDKVTGDFIAVINVKKRLLA